METNTTSWPKRKNKQQKLFERHIPGVGHSKARKNSKRSVSQFLQYLSYNNDSQSTRSYSNFLQPPPQPPPTPSDPPYIPTVNNGQTKKQLLLSQFVPKIGQSRNQQSPQQSTSSSLLCSTRLNNSTPVKEKQIRYGPRTYSVENIPSPYVLCLKNHWHLMKRKAELAMNIITKIKKKKCTVTNALSRRLLGIAAAISPKTSSDNLKKMIPLIFSSFLCECDFPFMFEDLSTSTVKSGAVKSMVIDTATDSLFIARNEILKENSGLFLSCDKGHSGNVGHFVKKLSWWSEEEKRIKVLTLDTDDSDGSSADCADAIQFSLNKLFFDVPLVLRGQTTDSGGGGTGFSLARELEKRAITCGPKFLVSFCTLHMLQLCLSNGVKETYGEGGFLPDGNFKRNAMQLVHGAYNLQASFPFPVWCRMFEEAVTKVDEEINLMRKKCLVLC